MFTHNLQHESIEQGKRLKATRKLTLLSRRAFAKKHQFNISSYQAWEDGKYKKGINLSNASKLAKAFALENINCSIDWLLNGNGSPAIRRKNIGLGEVIDDTYDNATSKANHYKEIKAANNKLIEAIKRNQIEECRGLILNGANLHTLSIVDLYLYSLKRFSALHFAAWYGGAMLIQMFVDLGLHPDTRNKDNDTPLHLAAWEGNDQAIKKLIDLGASIEATNNEGTTPIMWSASNGKPSVIPLLVSFGANINSRDYQGNTSAHWAAFKGNSDVIETLYNQGAFFDIKNYDNKTPLEVAILNGQTETVTRIMQVLGKDK
jgi:ankyrin repeat protein